MLTLPKSLLVLVAAALATPAQARNVTADPAQVADLLRAGSATVETKEEDGTPYLDVVIEDFRYRVLFLNCETDRKCKTVQFFAAFSQNAKFDTADANRFNAEYRFIRAYVDGDGDPALEMDVNLDFGGISDALFNDQVELWLSLAGAYMDVLYPDDGQSAK